MQMLSCGSMPFLNRQKIKELLLCDKWESFEIFSIDSVQTFIAVAAVAVISEIISNIFMLITSIS